MKTRPKQLHSKTQKTTVSPLSPLSPKDTLEFLDQFQKLMLGQDSETKLISIRVPENVLHLFRRQAEAQGMKYQSQIVRLMREWVKLQS